MIELAGRLLYYPIVAVLLLALFARVPAGERKRIALLAWAGLLLAVRAIAWLFGRLRVADALFALPVVAAIACAWAARAFLLPFRLRCARCGERLSPARVLGDDANLCERCAADRAGASTT